MPLGREDFKRALREVVAEDFAQIPTDENTIDVTFSNKFLRKMKRLIKAQRKPKPCCIYVNTAAKRAAIILAAIIAVFTTACSLKSIREPIINFFKEVYETFTHYSVYSDTIDVIEKEYAPTYIPEGFVETNKTNNKDIIGITYTNNNEIILFKQMTTEYSAGHYVDNEIENTVIKKVDGIQVEHKSWKGINTYVWTDKGYVFSLDFHCDTDFETVKQIILSIK